MASLFEGYERRIDQINAVLNSYGISSIEEAEKITKDAGLNVYDQVKKIQPICFENACWAYTVGAAIAIKKGCKRAADAAAAIVRTWIIWGKWLVMKELHWCWSKRRNYPRICL